MFVIFFLSAWVYCLALAALEGHTNVFQLLLNIRANFNFRSPPVFSCFRGEVANIMFGGHTLLSCVMWAACWNGWITDQDWSWNRCCEQCLFEVCLLAFFLGLLVAVVCQQSSSFSCCLQKGTTALISAAELGHVDVIRVLFNNGVNANNGCEVWRLFISFSFWLINYDYSHWYFFVFCFWLWWCLLLSLNLICWSVWTHCLDVFCG